MLAAIHSKDSVCDMWTIPTHVDSSIINMCRSLSCDWVGAVAVNSESAYDYNNCHNNVRIHCSVYGGIPVVGWYFLVGFNTIQAIRHTVWQTTDSIIDITPYVDNRQFIIFGRSINQCNDYSISNCYSHSLDKYLMQETDIMYYIYQLIDPRNGQPFYIGKGKGRRAKTHLWDIPETRNQYKENKIANIRQEGLEPEIIYIAENIVDEQLAYEMEAFLIKKYGRKGYDKDGILTNVCVDNRPPNHKGKTYEEIYGTEKAEEQKKLRSDLQKERGGYGPRAHSEETRKKIQESSMGENNGMWGKFHSEETKKIISDKAKLRVGYNNKLSKEYILTSPDGSTYNLFGGDLAKFCIEHNLSHSTLKKQTQKGSAPPKYGKTCGWILKENKGFSL